jgi:hypothetical protein
MGQHPETLSGVRVVIVSGDRECLQTAGLSLEVRGATVKCATSVEQGIAALGSLHPHVVVCDLSRTERQFNLLPELGPDVLSDSATVALTAFASKVVPGFDFCIDRHRDLTRLAELVTNVMRDRGVAAQSKEPGETPTKDQPVPPEQKHPPIDEPPGEPGSAPTDPRPEGDPPRNEPTRLVKKRGARNN